MDHDHPEDLFRQRLDQYINRYAEEIGYARVEEMLQARAQDMREMVPKDERITANDLDGWSEE